MELSTCKQFSLWGNVFKFLTWVYSFTVYIVFLAFFLCVYFYPSFFWVSLIAAVVATIVSVRVYNTIHGECDTWEFFGKSWIILGSQTLYLFSFFILHFLKWNNLIVIDIEWGIISLIATLSIAVSALIGGVFMGIEKMGTEEK